MRLKNNYGEDFNNLYIAQGISSFGDWISYVVMPLIIFNITKDPVAIAVYTLCKFIPNIIIAPYIKFLYRKFNPLRIMAFCDFIRGILFLVFLTTTNPLAIYIITFFISLLDSQKFSNKKKITPISIFMVS